MASKKRILVSILAFAVLFVVFKASDTSPQVATAHSQVSPMWRTKKALAEQRALVKELQTSAQGLKKDADAMHEEICP